MIRKLKCFFGWHDWIDSFYDVNHGDKFLYNVDIVVCKHCENLEVNMWRGFLTESKSYMNYPKCGRISFWCKLPKAWIKFKIFEFKYKRGLK